MTSIPSTISLVATICFALALVHTFSVKRFQRLAAQYPQGSVAENLFHLLGEVEVVFGIWAAVFVSFLAFSSGFGEAVSYLESRNFTEPAFVFVIMAISSTRPILHAANWLIDRISSGLPTSKPVAFYLTCLTIGPLLGSFITEPAAMTVSAVLLYRRFFGPTVSSKLKYATLGLLFVNVSIGGTLTPYAAPPVLMVAGVWNWDLTFMLQNFGWKAALAVFASTILVTLAFRNEIKKLEHEPRAEENERVPLWITALHLIALALVVLTSHHLIVFICVFLFFLGIHSVTREYQTEIKLREALLVGFFLGGLVILGGPQRWWLEPILTSLNELPLYFGATALTAFTDNAALTYLGSQVPSLTDSTKYALVAGSVVGGGLTVVANAPNPAGYAILNPGFGEEGISPLGLLAGALVPTIVAALIFFPY